MHRLEVSGISGWAALSIPVLAAAAAAVICRLFAHRVRVAALLAIALVIADGLGAFGAWKVGVMPSRGVSAVLSSNASPSWGPRPAAPGGVARFLIVGNRTVYSTDSYPDVSDIQDLRSANGYVPLGLAPKVYTAAVGSMTYEGNVPDTTPIWAPGGHLLDLLRVTTILFDPNATDPPPGADAVLAFAGSAGGGLVRYEHQPALPDAFIVGTTRVEARGQILSAVDGIGAWDPSSVGLLESGCGRCPTGRPGTAGQVVEERWTDQQVSAEVVDTRSGLLILSQAWFPGWTASVDGRPAPVVRADGLLQGVPVPPGDHQVTLSYHPPGLRWGVLLTALTTTALVGWAGGNRRRIRRV